MMLRTICDFLLAIGYLVLRVIILWPILGLAEVFGRIASFLEEKFDKVYDVISNRVREL